MMHVVKIAQKCNSWQVNWSHLASVDFSVIGPVVQKQLEVSQPLNCIRLIPNNHLKRGTHRTVGLLN